MRLLPAIAALLALSSPGHGQGAEVYAPCTGAGDLAGIAAAFRAAGWVEVADAPGIAAAMRVLGAVRMPVIDPPSPFLDAEDATHFADLAAASFARQQTLGDTPVFARDGVLAMGRLPADMQGDVVLCLFGATEFPGMEAMLSDLNAETGFGDGLFGAGMTFAIRNLDGTSGAVSPDSFVAFRLEGSPDAIAALPARYGLLLTRILPPTGG